MSSAARALSESRRIRGLFLFLGIIGLVWILSNAILTGSTDYLAMGGLGIGLGTVTFFILKDWRSGFLLFLLWLLFEDLARKYLGNGTILFFGKDVLAGITYLSLFLAKRRGQAQSFRPPFLVPLGLFFGLALVQVFNPSTPSILYGLLGLKLYFYYIPLLFVGYALVRDERELNRFLVFNIVLGSIIAALGIAQSIIGLSFLNPATLAPELEELGNLTRKSPLSQRLVPVPTSVFVSGGRFSTYMILLVILAMGAQGYGLLTRRRGAWFGLLGIGLALMGAMQSGSRGSIIFALSSIAVISAGLLWGNPTRRGKSSRLSKAVVRSFLVGALGLFLMVQLFPDSIGAAWAFYSETLSPSSSAFELSYRAWDYPIQNLEKAFYEGQHWVTGMGTGTASLGGQYISRLLGVQGTGDAVENGYGNLVVEMGILGPILWIAWTFSCLYYEWKIVRQLRGTAYLPVGLSIWWFSFLLLVPFTFGGLTTYQNFVMNAYFWILTGMLFRLPDLARLPQPALQQQAKIQSTATVPVLLAGR